MIAIYCPHCGKDVTVAVTNHYHHISACGDRNFKLECPHCAKTVHVEANVVFELKAGESA
jgi:endogenous inhibitor of DNA gyrase (YacG/DUF329 family)